MLLHRDSKTYWMVSLLPRCIRLIERTRVGTDCVHYVTVRFGWYGWR